MAPTPGSSCSCTRDERRLDRRHPGRRRAAATACSPCRCCRRAERAAARSADARRASRTRALHRRRRQARGASRTSSPRRVYSQPSRRLAGDGRGAPARRRDRRRASSARCSRARPRTCPASGAGALRARRERRRRLLRLSSSTTPGGVSLVVADVAGHSIGSALMMAMARSMLRREISRGSAPAAVLAATNEGLFDDLVRSGLFFTVFCARLDPHDRRARVRERRPQPAVRPARRRQARGARRRRRRARDRRATPRSSRSSLDARAGDTLLLYTDGVTEARRPGGEQFGEQRLRRRSPSGRRAPSLVARSSPTSLARRRRAAGRRRHACRRARRRGSDDRAIVVADDSRRAASSSLLALDAARVRGGDGDRRPEALEQIHEHEPKLVILDAMMPRGDGYEVCQALREDHDGLEKPYVIMLTAGGRLRRPPGARRRGRASTSSSPSRSARRAARARARDSRGVTAR